jgi:hypothetical protein
MATAIPSIPVDVIVGQRYETISFRHIHGSEDSLKMIDIAFYTCYFGPDRCWSNQVKTPPSKDHPCYYFTNNQKTFDTAKQAGWIAVWEPIPIENDQVRDAQNSKLVRCCPHLFEQLKKHTHLCYLDSKLWITDLDRILSIAKDLTDETPLCMSRHPAADNYTTVWDEYTTAMQQDRYGLHRDRYKLYIETMLKIGFEDIPLKHCSGFRIEKRCPLAQRIGENWYAHIGRCGIECQIAWQFVVQQFPGAITEVPYKSVWNAV